MTENIL
jgi:SHS family lactate transporter-like MFS transporter